MRTTAKLFSVLLAFSLSIGTGFANSYEVDTPERVVAFADVHGAFDDWTAMLKELGVIDAKLNWSGGKTHLVSVGDLIDRGPGSRKVVELLMKLSSQSAKAGGAVHLTLGNHEVMVMTGDLRYVSPAEFAAFAGDETQADRDALYAEYRRFNTGGEDADVRPKFDMQYPRGFVALKKAFAIDGKLGSWLSQQPFVIRVNDKVYMHGGISSDVSEKSIASLNQQMQGELREYLSSIETLQKAGVMPMHIDYFSRRNFLNAQMEDYAKLNPGVEPGWYGDMVKVFDAQKHFVFSDDSLNWYRGTAMCHPYAESFNTERFLKRVGAKQLVMGHTPTKGKVRARMDGLAIRLDTGMLKAVYKGQASALVSQDGPDYIHYLGSTEKFQPLGDHKSLAQKLSGMSDVELEELMRTAPIVNIEKLDTGITNPKRVTQAENGVTNDAVFKYEDTNPGIQSRKQYIPRRYKDSDRYVYDVAAYKLDRMLGWEMVPTAVIAEVEGDEGALSDWVENAINERDRLEKNVPFEGYCKQQEQYRLRFIFDILIHNDDRNLTNILWTKDDFMMKFIDHSLAFRVAKKRPKQYKKVLLQVSDLLEARLKSLTKENLTRELSAYLHPRQIEGILARRDLILKEARGTSK
ncbi:MAG: metallophosphoesterase [Proteobacteria bacterium]|nr:metallophosphoesterase [Pseudomonadota bacterium]